jgi:hypothetical protein
MQISDFQIELSGQFNKTDTENAYGNKPTRFKVMFLVFCYALFNERWVNKVFIKMLINWLKTAHPVRINKVLCDIGTTLLK